MVIVASQLHCGGPALRMQSHVLQGSRPQTVRPNQSSGRVSRASAVRVQAASNPATDKYDYIIVGGGSAGCVLANKLSAGEKRVLVLEAGPSGDSLEIAVPAAITRLFKHPVFDWGLSSTPQSTTEGREVYLARGRALGGSSCTNATLYTRGAPSDYDSWGLDGWSSKDVMDWFIKAENYSDGPAPYHGVGGTMNVERPRYDNPMHEEFFRACAAAGMPANPDFNNWSWPQAGYGEFQVTQRKGERADMYRMYLKPAINRGNLKVLTGTRTTKLHFEKSTSSGTRVAGVEFTQAESVFGERFSATLAPGGEVLMCAGTVHTPHLLQLSGVGAAGSLREHGIDVVADLPGVGANLQDHPATLWAARTDEKFDNLSVTSQIYDKKSNIKIGKVLQYLISRTGPLATTGCDHGAFVSTTGQGEPDLQIRFVPGCSLDADAIQSYIKFGELKRRGLAWPCGVTMQLLASRPKSSGAISLRSSDPFAAPLIDLGYFSDKGHEDMATLVAGLKIARNIAQQSPLAKYITEERYPGPGIATDADLEAFVRKTTCSGNALVGTCRMGGAGDAGAVVDSADLSVFGIAGLRVIDASVIPRIPGGQTGAATVMVAERAAALLVGGVPIVPPKTNGARQLVAA